MTVGLVVATLYWTVLRSYAESGAAKRPFTIEDSIELAEIVDPAQSTVIGIRPNQPRGVPIYSSDAKYFLLVTQRGLVSTNQLESAIWLFDRKMVRDYVRGNSDVKPVPRKLISVRATSNTPVIADVRWVGNSDRVAFLAKNGSPYQRLFVVDLKTGSVHAITGEKVYVTSYEMRDEVIVYTTLVSDSIPRNSETELIDIEKQNLLTLLYRDPPAIEDIEESYLLKQPNILHVQKAGLEMPVRFTGKESPLRLFVPTLSLSPDAKLLLTVAAVVDVPKTWEKYQPKSEKFRLKSGTFQAEDRMTLESFWRPEQYVVVNLETGEASPFLDAPAARDMGYGGVPTQAFWLPDSRHAVLTNTYLPLSSSIKEMSQEPMRNYHPTFALVDVPARAVQGSIDFRRPASSAKAYAGIEDVEWNRDKSELTLGYENGNNHLGRTLETYAVRSTGWVRTQSPDSANEDGIELSIHEDLNHAGVLWALVPGRETGLPIWDPNPQLEHINLGSASMCHWQDSKGRRWTGILVLPPGYDAKRRYPLVIQTHGYEGERFFADGATSTGSGGRALAGRNVIVLQMGDTFPHIGRPQEARDELGSFESAIDVLAASGKIDRARVGIIGFSRTCFHVMYAITHQPTLFKAAAITDGVNFGYVEYMLLASGDQYQGETEAVNGGPPFGNNLMTWVRNTPTFGLDKVQAPLLVSAYLKGTLLSQWEIYSGLRRLNKPVEMVWWRKANTPHILVQPAQRYASQQSAVDWFDFWLNNAKDLDPKKSAQYRRWERLRKLEVRRNKPST